MKAFIPLPLPPRPPLPLEKFALALDRANQALGKLDGLSTLLPDTNLFLFLYVRKEAVLSSQIEGTQSSLSDLLLFENAGVSGIPMDDVREVSNYVAAMHHGLERMRKGFPVSLRLIREMHALLLRDGRGRERTPGEFRRSQNWIGGTRPGNAGFVPPPPERIMECLDSLEKFLHEENETLPLLIQLGMVHVQFESIHPFLDGNGRLGRLLITLMLCAKGVLQEPLLFLSLYFKIHRTRYYELLQRVRTDGDWESWILFFLEGTEQTAKQAATTASELIQLFDKDRKRIQTIGRPASSALRLHEYMRKHPLLSISAAAKELDLTVPTIGSALTRLEKMGIVAETTGRGRDRVFGYKRYLEIVSAGTEPVRP